METFCTSKTAAPANASGCTLVAVSGTASLAMTSSSGCSMMFLARVAGEASGNDTGDDHQDEGYDNQRQSGSPGAALGADVRRLGVREDLRRQRRVRAAEQVRVRRLHREDGEQQRCRLAR